ncbi:taf13 (nucleomorph) [Hemiselmis andersenii]|uniref:Transcription initiation factor TFIID subunit 13 n=3 Tax=Hemiselmis andersenii TaxID=464988 RepID=A9BKV7_HEMAN|nr:taf13 [Hemiselmis andersenii]ABW98112.1 taf13 [Hemiselmis andersenii]
MKKKNKKLEKRNNKIKNFRKKLKYFEILGLKENSKLLTTKMDFLKYNFFRKTDFLYKLPKFNFLKKKIFQNELAEVMFGFGDSENPLKKTILFLEKLILNFFHNLISSVTYIAFWRAKKRPTVEDLVFCIRNNPRKLSKITYLLKMKILIEKIMGSQKKSPSFKTKNMFPLKITQMTDKF